MYQHSWRVFKVAICATATMAANTVYSLDLADGPVAQMSTATVKPNIYFILDDSGSMDYQSVPDALENYTGYMAYKNSTCNPLYFNPDADYSLPVDANGNALAIPSFKKAPDNGFDSSSSTTDLSTKSYHYTVPTNIKTSSSDLLGGLSGCYKDQNSKSNYYYTSIKIDPVANPDLAKKYAIWYSYYRSRLMMMKTSVGLAFSKLNDQYRVGFNTIWNRGYVKIDDFVAGAGKQRETWYNSLYARTANGGTPLIRALSDAGRMYAGKAADDPIQASCQRNFTILSTDGYWNSGQDAYKENGTTLVGDQDGGLPLPMTDTFSQSNTLADVAAYYFNTDLRPTGSKNKAGKDVSAPNVPTSDSLAYNTEDNNPQQHMTTFTMGLGISGLLPYVENYKTDVNSAYSQILAGSTSVKWPKVDTSNDGPTKIDDLWHAAVNGHGLYFSARDPDAVMRGLNRVMMSIKAKDGAAAAAATSNLEPVTGDDFAYVGSFRTTEWIGDLDTYQINLDNGEISGSPVWSAGKLLDARNYTDRKIYTWSSKNTNNLMDFSWANMSSQLSPFDYKKLSQYSSVEDASLWVPNGGNQAMFNFLIGDRTKEGYGVSATGLFRQRTSVLGDIINAQPVYVKASPFVYTKGAFANRDATVYVASNDGMLHAFDAQPTSTTLGQERWAYVPPAVTPNMWKLADVAYPHYFYVDGTPVASDVLDGSQWRTVLVGGLNKGGKSFYALDVSDPTKPVGLWNYTDANMGYSYGNPVVTKVSGQWVVLLTSGYEATNSDRLIMVDALTGAVVKTFPTGATNGLAKVANWVDDMSKDNTTRYAYAGDLAGNVWKFDLQAADGTKPSKVISVGKPITTKPELAEIGGRRIVYFGTGELLGKSDLTTTATQTFYGVLDNGTTIDPATLALRTPAPDTATSRKVTGAAIDWTTQNGWYVDLTLSSGERVVVDPKIQLGTLVFSTNVPQATECTPDGVSWLYFLDFTGNGTGAFVGNAFTVGMNIVKLPNGKVVTIATTSDNKHPVFNTPVQGVSGGGKRVSWRELFAN